MWTAKAGGSKGLVHIRWSGGRGYLRRREKIGYERFEIVRGECASVKMYEHHLC